MKAVNPRGLLQVVMEELMEQKKVELVDDVFHPDFLNHNPAPGYPGDREGLRQFFNDLFYAFSDFRVDYTHLMMDGDHGVVRFVIQGTHTNEFMGVPGTEKQLVLPAISIIRMQDGKIIERWSEQDNLEAMNQLWN